MMVVAAFTLAANAAGPQKAYSLKMLSFPAETFPGSGITQVPVRVEVTIRNESPPSTNNSNIGSFTFKLSGATVATDVAPICDRALCSVTSDTVTVTNISPPIQAPPNQDYTVTFYVTSCGDVTAIDPTTGQAGAAVYGGSQINGSTFSFKNDAGLPTMLSSAITCGELGCDGLALQVPGSVPAVYAIRGQFDKDGVCGGTLFPYYVTNLIGTSAPKLHFRWPALGVTDPGFFAAFKYTINTTANNDADVAWLPATGDNPQFIPGPACLSNKLPAPYASLAANVATSDKKIVVSLYPGVAYADLPAVPFPIVIGVERMDVTKVNAANGTWTVTRKTGGTSAGSYLASDGVLVMSTPLPILPGTKLDGTPRQPVSGPYSNGDHAHMCIYKDGADLWVVDIGDGWVSPK